MKNPINAYKLFDTPTSYDDLLAWCEQLTGNEKYIAMTAAHTALNLAHHIVQNAINEEKKSADCPSRIFGFETHP